VTIMNRYAREQLIERLQAENAEMLTDCVIRRARRLAGQEPREWQTPEPPANQKLVQREITGLIYKTHENDPLPHPAQEPMSNDMLQARIEDSLEVLAGVIGGKVGKIEKGLRQQIAELQTRVAVLEGLLKGAVINLPSRSHSDAA